MKLPFVLPSNCKQSWHSLVREVKKPGSEETNLVFVNSFNIDNIFNAFSSGAITERDISVLRFLFERKFSTVSQIARSFFPGKPVNMVRKRLKRFVRHQIIDSFSLEKDGLTNDMAVYCLGPGGYHLLKSFDQSCGRWYRRNNMRSSEDITGILIANEFSLKMPLEEHQLDVDPFIKFSSSKLYPTAVLNFKESVFLLKSIRGVFDEKQRTSLSLFDSFIEGQAWRNFYINQPILILIAESDTMSFEISNFLKENTTLTRFRFTTDERIFFRPLDKSLFTIDGDNIVERVAKIFSFTQAKEASNG